MKFGTVHIGTPVAVGGGVFVAVAVTVTMTGELVGAPPCE
jgi:hypothetical protein